MSFHDSDSDISRINRALPGEELRVHPHTGAVLGLASEIWRVSEGAFNIACATRLIQWGRLPGDRLALPAYQPLEPVIDVDTPQSVRKLVAGRIDVGGIAKGYAVDVAIEVLRQHGVTTGCVNAGGDLRVIGPRAFAVSIRDPSRPTRMAKDLQLQEEAVATSAPYFSLMEADGDATSALCNGLTGTAIVAPLSVTVRAPSCAQADALTKVVLSTGNTAHPALERFGATSFMIWPNDKKETRR